MNATQVSCIVIAPDGHLVVGNRVILRVVVEVTLDMSLGPKYLSNESLDQFCTTLL